MWKEQILSSIGEDLDKKIWTKPKIFRKKNIRTHLYHQFNLVLATIQINWIWTNQGSL